MERLSRIVLRCEAWCNLVILPTVMLWPRDTLLSLMGEKHEANVNVLTAELWRWFAMICFGFSGISLAWALESGCDATERVVFTAHCVTDVLFVTASTWFAIQTESLTVAMIFSSVVGLIYFLARVVILAKKLINKSKQQ